jgi:hypothetical protein
MAKHTTYGYIGTTANKLSCGSLTKTAGTTDNMSNPVSSQK